MCELTENEKTVLADLKAELSNKETLNKIVTAQYLLNELESQFGVDVLNFVIGYLSGSLQYENGFDGWELSTLEKAGDLSRYGYGKFHDEVNDLMGKAGERHCVDVHSEVATGLTTAVNNITESKKVPWVDIYNKSVEKGIIKGVNNDNTNSKAD